jgi:hypothetical protein
MVRSHRCVPPEAPAARNVLRPEALSRPAR